MLVASSALIKVVPGLMIWTLVAFVITLVVLKKYAFGPVQAYIDARRDRIRETIEEADHAREEARSLLEEHRKLIGQARSDAESILAEARKIGESQRERMREEIEQDRQRQLEETKRQIEQSTTAALNQLRADVADLTLQAVEKITRSALDEKDQKRLIDEALAEIDFSQLEASRS